MGRIVLGKDFKPKAYIVGANDAANLTGMLIQWFVIAALIAFVVFLFVGVPKLLAHISNYQDLNYPYKAVAFVYHMLFKVTGFFFTAPYELGNWISNSGFTTYNNLNTIIGIVIGIFTYCVFFGGIYYLFKISRLGLFHYFLIALSPAFLALAYFLVSLSIQWLFHSEPELQQEITSPVEIVTETPVDNIQEPAVATSGTQEYSLEKETSISIEAGPSLVADTDGGLVINDEQVSENSSFPSKSEANERLDPVQECPMAARSLNQC
jgi:hypothetical protein